METHIGGTLMDTKMADVVTKVTNKLTELEQTTDIDWSLFKIIMENTDFRRCATAVDSVMLFYKQLWTHALAPLEEEKLMLQKEIGRFIISLDEQERLNKTLQEEVTALREQIQGPSKEVSQGDPED